MAIAFDASSFGYNGNPAVTSLTVSHTVASGASVLVVMASAQGTSDLISGITYNSVAMTRRVEADITGIVAIYTLDAPDPGTHDIVLSLSSGTRVGLGGVSFTSGAYALGGSGTNNGNGTTATQTTATTGTTGFICATLFFNDAASTSYTGGGTSIVTTQDANYGRSFVYDDFSASDNPSQTWTQTNSRDWDTAYLEVYDVASANGNMFFLL